MSRGTARVVEQEIVVPVGALPEQAFPLLCPVREYEWVDGWSCRLVHSRSGFVEEGCVFETDRAPDGPTTWVTVEHDPVRRRVGFLRFTPGRHVSRMELEVQPAGSGRAALRVRYRFTANSPQGEDEVRRLEDGVALAARAAHLGRALEHFLVTGTKLLPSAGGGVRGG